MPDDRDTIKHTETSLFKDDLNSFNFKPNFDPLKGISNIKCENFERIRPSINIKKEIGKIEEETASVS